MAPPLVIPDDDTVDQEGAAAPGLDTADQLMDQVTDQSPYDRVRAGCLFALQTLLDRRVRPPVPLSTTGWSLQASYKRDFCAGSTAATNSEDCI